MLKGANTQENWSFLRLKRKTAESQRNYLISCPLILGLVFSIHKKIIIYNNIEIIIMIIIIVMMIIIIIIIIIKQRGESDAFQ